MVDEDRQWLDAFVRDGDAGAFGKIVERHIGFVYSAAMRQIEDRQIAEDIVQAVFLLLSQKAGTLGPEMLVRGWLFQATRYAARNARRAEDRRKEREREVAAMRPESTSHEGSEEIGPHLDDALAGLSTKDRTVILRRYFEGMPLAALGETMGISEHAAKKRVGRALERLKDNLLRRGVEVGEGDALGSVLMLGAKAIAPTPLSKATVDFVIRGATAGAKSSAAIPLAKRVSKIMSQTKVKLVAIKCVLGITCVGMAATIVVEGTRQQPANFAAARRTIATVDSAAEARAADAQLAETQFQECRQAIAAIIEAHDQNDTAMFKAHLYVAPDANPQVTTAILALIDVDLAVYRLEKTAVDRFGAHALNINTCWTTLVPPLEELMARVGPKDWQLSGGAVILTPPAPSMSHNGAWPAAPIYFHDCYGIWKLDASRTLLIRYHIKRRWPIAGETQDQTLTAAVKMWTDGFNAISEDIKYGKVANAAEVQKRVDEVMVELSKQFSEFEMDQPMPKSK